MAAVHKLITRFILLSVMIRRAKSTSKPNIVFIVADDLGWDDVSFHGSNEVLTPNIDLLAHTGIALERYYTHCVCTPSRAALLTGKFAHTTGMHGYPLTNAEDRGLPLTEKLLPEYLKELGYATHLVGKWHLGQSRSDYLPTSRGFDSHFGYRGGFVDYYEYVSEETWTSGPVAGMDLYRNLTPAWDVEGYLTDVFTDEAKKIIEKHNKSQPLFLMLSHLAPHSGNDGALLQAPPDVIRSLRHVANPERRIFAAMMKKLDESVGEVVTELSEHKMLENSIIVFISDNGGMTLGNSINYASNWPLRGEKFTPYEGGIRATAIVWAPRLSSSEKHLWKGYMHAVDWLPTLLGAIGANVSSKIDGVNLWNNILSNQASRRQEFFEIYTYGETSFSTIISGDYKLVTGNIGKDYSSHLGGDLKGLNGGPAYNEVIADSEIYCLLNDDAKIFKNEKLRDDIQVKCESPLSEDNLCNPDATTGRVCLFNIMEDPCELTDLSALHPEIVQRLAFQLQAEMKRAILRPNPLYRDPRGKPCLHNYTWSTWAEHI